MNSFITTMMLIIMKENYESFKYLWSCINIDEWKNKNKTIKCFMHGTNFNIK